MATRKRNADNDEKYNQARRVARAEKKLRMTRAATTRSTYRQNAKPGEGKSAKERKRNWRAKPENKKREKDRRKERQKEMPEEARLAAAERDRERKKRSRELTNMAKAAGGEDKPSSWVRVYGAKALEHPQESREEIEATIEALAGQGFRIVKDAITTKQLEEILKEVEETSNLADNGKGWADTFSTVDAAGRLTPSSERQMAKMPRTGVTCGIAQELVQKYLGKGWTGELEVKSLCLLDTLSLKHQIDHTDYPRGLAKLWRTRFPIGAIIVIEEDSVFSTWNGSVDTEDTTGQRRLEPKLEPRSVVFIHAVKPHRGFRYIVRNKRLHFYAAHKDFKVETNQTYPLPNLAP